MLCVWARAGKPARTQCQPGLPVLVPLAHAQATSNRYERRNTPVHSLSYSRTVS